MSSKMSAEIAEVSFAPFLHGNAADRQAVAQEIFEAFSTVGFVYVKDHGIAQDRVDAIFGLVRLSCTMAEVETR